MAVKKINRTLPPDLTQEIDGFFYQLLSQQEITSRMEVLHLDTEPAMGVAIVAVVLPSSDVEQIVKKVYSALTTELSRKYGTSMAVLSLNRPDLRSGPIAMV